MSSLKVANLSVSYGGVRAITGVSLELEVGRCTAIIGANGAGKTSLLRGISGLTPATSDGIWLDGEAVDRLPAEQRVKRGLGHVLEGRHVFPGLTVLENLELGQAVVSRRPLAEALARAYQMFPDLESRKNQPAGSLSGGQQQFLAIARAMMSDPKVMLLDEPTVGLAPRLIERVSEVILELVRHGTTVLLVEQTLEVVAAAAETVHMLSHGRLVGTTQARSPNLAEIAHQLYLS